MSRAIGTQDSLWSEPLRATLRLEAPLDVDKLVADVRRAEADTIAFVGTGRFRRL